MVGQLEEAAAGEKELQSVEWTDDSTVLQKAGSWAVVMDVSLVGRKGEILAEWTADITAVVLETEMDVSMADYLVVMSAYTTAVMLDSEMDVLSADYLVVMLVVSMGFSLVAKTVDYSAAMKAAMKVELLVAEMDV